MNNEKLMDKFLNKFDKRSKARSLINVFEGRKKSIEHYSKIQSDFKIENKEVIKINEAPSKYLFTSDVSQTIGDKNCVIIGESAARCYGIDPIVNYKKILSISDPSYNYIDLSKTSLPSQDILSQVKIINEINPQKLIVGLGNNLPNYLFLNSYYMDYLESKSIDAEEYIGNLHYEYFFKPLVEKLLKEINIKSENIVFFIPMGNVFKWKRRVKVISDESSNISKYCPVNNFKLGIENNNIDQLERAYEFVVDRKSTLPGLGKVAAKSYRKVLSEKSLNYIDFRKILSSKGDFIDYCHLSLEGISKVAREIIISGDFKFNKKEVNALLSSLPAKEKMLESKYLLHKMEKQSITFNKKYKKINDLFCGKPLFFIDSYHHLLEDVVLRQILAIGNPKSILNASNENSQVLGTEMNLLSLSVNNDFFSITQFAKKPKNFSLIYLRTQLTLK